MADNLELINRGLAAFSRNDFDEAVSEMHPDIEWHIAFRMPELPPNTTVFHGTDEVRALWSMTKAAWDDLCVGVEDVIDERGDVVVVRARFVGRLRSAGLEIDRVVYYVFELEDEKLRRLRPFDSKAEALAAARG